MIRKIDVAVIGHFSLDENISPRGTVINVLGGAPVYSATTFSKLGLNVGVCAGIGEDQHSNALQYCKTNNINYEGLTVYGSKTLHFKNIYDANEARIQICHNVPRKLKPQDLPSSYFQCVAHYVSPLVDELELGFIDFLRRMNSVLMLDPQGLMRTINSEGKVTINFDKEKLAKFFQKVDIVKIGKDEISAFGLTELEIISFVKSCGVKIVILTRGKDSVIASFDSSVIEVDTIDVDVQDPTGAGDVFGAAFLAQYLKTSDLIESIRFANIVAGLKIRSKGPKGFPELDEIIAYKNRKF